MEQTNGSETRFRRDAAVEEIRDRIVSGELKPGTLVYEKQLAGTLKMSRTPLREALAVLARDGLIEQVPQIGIRVREIPHHEIIELLRLRSAIEAMVVAQLAKGHQDNGLHELDHLIRETEEAAERNDRQAFLEKDSEFHCKMAELAQFYLAGRVLRNLRDKIRMVGADAISTDGKMKEALQEHRNILSAIVRRDPSEAENVLRDHLRRTAERIGIEYADDR